MMLWTIYDHPDDYPEHYVVRQYEVASGEVVAHGATLFNTLKEARASVQRGRVSIARHLDDDPKIVETWL